MELNELYKIAEDNNLEIVYLDFDSSNGLFFSEKNRDCIILSSNLSCEEEICVLAEELTHYKVGVIQNIPFERSYNNKLKHSKNENKACKYMTNEFIHISKFKRFLMENKTNYEIAEEIGISQEFLERTYKLYMN